MEIAFKIKSGFGLLPDYVPRERRDGARQPPPMGGGQPRAMLAPDASVGNTENSEKMIFPKSIICFILRKSYHHKSVVITFSFLPLSVLTFL